MSFQNAYDHVCFEAEVGATVVAYWIADPDCPPGAIVVCGKDGLNADEARQVAALLVEAADRIEAG